MSSMTDPTNPGTITVADGHVVHTCCGKLDDEPHRNFCPQYRPVLDLEPGCPEWCTIEHAEDDDRDDLALHMGDDHTDGYARRLLNVHEDYGSKLLVRVARTDDLGEGTTGVPALLVTADLELTTWEQAGELARTILDGFGYLEGADRG
jgi:hypothetical protein